MQRTVSSSSLDLRHTEEERRRDNMGFPKAVMQLSIISSLIIQCHKSHDQTAWHQIHSAKLRSGIDPSLSPSELGTRFPFTPNHYDLPTLSVEYPLPTSPTTHCRMVRSVSSAPTPTSAGPIPELQRWKGIHGTAATTKTATTHCG